MNPDKILGLDIGSSSIRAALFDLKGRMLSETLVRRNHRNPGAAQFDAEELFESVCDVIDETLVSDVPGEVTHIASCAFWHSLVGVDSRGKLITSVLTWADTRSRDCTSVLRIDFDESETHQRTGARFHSSFWPAKLLWLKGGNPSGSEGVAFRKTAKWLSFSDYLTLKFCGRTDTSTSMASGTGIFDQQRCDWDLELRRYLRVKASQLPTITNGASRLSSNFRKRWPRLNDALWFPSIGDGAANNVGTGCITKNRAALTLGTSGALRVVYEGAPPNQLPSGLWCYGVDQKRVIVGGALSDGGGLYRWLRSNLEIGLNDKEIGREMARRGANAHGLIFMPFFNGERSTGYNESARGAILGLTASHDAIDILQAAMEAVAFRFAEIFDQLQEITRIDEIVVSGGALRSAPVWSQIIADVLGRDLLASREAEPSMRGAVLLALESLGKMDSTHGFPDEKEQIVFHPQCHDIYNIARKRHQAAYPRLMS